MRKNEYNSLDEVMSEITGVWGPSDGHWFGIDFMYKGNEYRIHTGSMYLPQENVDDNGRVHQFGLYKKTDMIDKNFPNEEIYLYELLYEFGDFKELLEKAVIDNKQLKEIIVEDETEILGKD